MASSNSSTIGPGIAIDGRLTGDSDVTVEGRVEGTVSLNSHLLVADEGTVVAELDVESVTVEGTLDGDVVAQDTVRLAAGCNVTGNIRAPRINIEEGAKFKGNIDMDVDLPEVE